MRLTSARKGSSSGQLSGQSILAILATRTASWVDTCRRVVKEEGEGNEEGRVRVRVRVVREGEGSRPLNSHYLVVRLHRYNTFNLKSL